MPQALEQIRHSEICEIRNVDATFVCLQLLLDVRLLFSVNGGDAPYHHDVFCAGQEPQGYSHSLGGRHIIFHTCKVGI